MICWTIRAGENQADASGAAGEVRGSQGQGRRQTEPEEICQERIKYFDQACYKILSRALITFRATPHLIDIAPHLSLLPLK
jgi:hypothetical protein